MKCETAEFVPNRKDSWKERNREQQVGRKGILESFWNLVFTAKKGTPLPPGGRIVSHRSSFTK